MRVTFLLPRYPWRPSGGYIVVYRYATELATRGHEVSVVHPRRLPSWAWPAPAGPYGRLRRVAARVRDLLFRPGIDWSPIDERVRLLYVPALTERHLPDADALIATWWSTAELALALPPAKGAVHHLIQGHEIWHGSEDRVHALWRAPIPKIVIASWLLDLGVELGVPQALMTHIPNAIDREVFTLRRPLEHRPRRVAMLYSSQRVKGGDLGLDILRRARERVTDLTAFVFGADPAPPRLPHWITYVHRATPGGLAEAFNRCAVYLCPSLSEGWHLPPAEAMACGCALVSSDIGGVRDYAEHGTTARLYPPEDVEAGAEHLGDVLLDDAARTALARSGCARIATFSWQRSTDLLEALLERHVRS